MPIGVASGEGSPYVVLVETKKEHIMSRSKTRAWDSIWNHLESIHQLGAQNRKNEQKRKEFAAILDSLRNELTVDQAHRMSDAILLAYEIGKGE
jgi:hypothetical protein